MGICYWDAKMLWDARLRDVSFQATATVGHQSLLLHPAEIRFFKEAFRARHPHAAIKPLENCKMGGYADGFLRDLLGVETLSVMDASDYEGANVVHDLNLPVPQELHGRFDAVIDGGSLEHIFNFPVAIGNLMKMLKPEGSLFLTNPANNQCGHGFYQFSPELMFRIFAKENGFELVRVALFEADYPSIQLTPHRRAFEVVDPEEARSRVGIMSKKAISMMVEARKIADVPLFANPPTQSDYVAKWNENAPQSPLRNSKLLMSIFKTLPAFLQASILGYREKQKYSFSNKRFYKELR